MSQDFRAIISHNLNFQDITSLPSKMDYLMYEIDEYMIDTGLNNISSSYERWVLNINEEHGTISLWGPGSLFLNIGTHTASMGCWIRWKEFLQNETIRNGLRAITLHVGEVFNSSRAIYLPDSSWSAGTHALNKISEGLTFDEILEQLKNEAGPPASDIFSIYKMTDVEVDGRVYNCFDGNGYYVDRFHRTEGFITF